jgi:uncharacterized protein YgiM (DUF1202 family)
MLKRLTTLLLVGLLANAAMGQASESFTGRVTGDKVRVRSGPGTTWYAVTELNTGDRVRVVGTIGDWYKIAPLAGTFSVISKNDARLADDGRTATVTTENAWLRSGGEMYDRRSISEFSVPQAKLARGKQLRVIEAGNDFYKVTPPEGVIYYIAAQYVERAGATDTTDQPRTTPRRAPVIERPRETAPEDATEEAPTESTTAPAETPTTTTAPTTGPAAAQRQQLEQAIEQFKVFEAQLRREYAKPAAERNLEGLVACYKSIDPAGNETLESAIEGRVQWLRGEMSRMEELASVRQEIEKIRARQKEYELDRTRMRVEEPTTQPILRYAAEGVLSPSEIFTAGGAVPKRWMVRDTRTNRIVAYVQDPDGQANLRAFEGRRVGIFGPTRFNARLGLDIIEAEQVVPLDGQEETAPAERPTPRPAPEAETTPEPAESEGVIEATHLPATGLPLARPTTAPTRDESQYQ